MEKRRKGAVKWICLAVRSLERARISPPPSPSSAPLPAQSARGIGREADPCPTNRSTELSQLPYAIFIDPGARPQPYAFKSSTRHFLLTNHSTHFREKTETEIITVMSAYTG